MMALHVWSLSHGIASLFARGDAGRRKLPMSAEELLEAGRAGLSARAGASERRGRPRFRENRPRWPPLDKAGRLLVM